MRSVVSANDAPYWPVWLESAMPSRRFLLGTKGGGARCVEHLPSLTIIKTEL
jgi:hypothetical protein